MDNVYDNIRAGLTFNKFEVGNLLFVEYTCPITEDDDSVYSQTDFFIHVLSGKKVWKNHNQQWVVKAGDTLFIKKGAFVINQFFDDEFCMFGFFVPDDFIRETITEITGKIPLCGSSAYSEFDAISVRHNEILTGFFNSMYPFFKRTETPSSALLELKLKELVINILSTESNQELSGYFQSLTKSGRPTLRAVMERNFCYNLSITEFARLSHRSVSTFKRDFKQCFNTTPGKWLLNRRLEFASMLLANNELNVSRAAYESGFEDASHFSRSFKEKFGLSPNHYRHNLIKS